MRLPRPINNSPASSAKLQLGMLAGSGGLFFHQQQQQQKQRRRELHSQVLSPGNEAVAEQLGTSMSDDDSSVVLDFRDDFSDASSVSRYRNRTAFNPPPLRRVCIYHQHGSAGISSVSSRSRAPTPLDALHGDFVELGGSGDCDDSDAHSPMLSRSGSNCSSNDDDSPRTARARLWMEYLQVPLTPPTLAPNKQIYDTRNLTNTTSSSLPPSLPLPYQASACHSVPLELLVNLRSDITPTLMKDCIAVLKGACLVPADVKVTSDTVQRLAWLASVAAATIVPTYRNALPLLLLPLLHTGMPNAAVLSCFERLVNPAIVVHHSSCCLMTS